MKLVAGDLWEFHDKDCWICVTVNGSLKIDGTLVMGKGCAKQAAQRYPDLPAELGRLLKAHGNVPQVLYDKRIITFPVKRFWHEPGYLPLIKRSATRIRHILDVYHIQSLVIPRPGCGEGRLSWDDVRPVLEEQFDDRVIIIVRYPSQLSIPSAVIPVEGGATTPIDVT